MVLSLGAMITAAVAVARTVLPAGARLLARHATDELYQLTIIAFCLVGSFISGRLVRPSPLPPLLNRLPRFRLAPNTVQPRNRALAWLRYRANDVLSS